jgi:hypothetical protein
VFSVRGEGQGRGFGGKCWKCGSHGGISDAEGHVIVARLKTEEGGNVSAEFGAMEGIVVGKSL